MYILYSVTMIIRRAGFMGSYIEFVFDETETNFIEITDGEYCG